MLSDSSGAKRSGPKVDVGDVLPCTIISALGGRRFEVVSKRAPRNWRVVLESKNPRGVREGDHTDFWVVRVDPKRREVLVRDGTHGRLPISESMRQRYLLAVRGLTEPETLHPDELLEALAEAKGMLSRVIKQDSADWLSVFQLLGKPRVGSIQRSLDELTELRDKLKAGEPMDQDLLERATRPFYEGLDRALEALTYPDRAEATIEEEDDDYEGE
jgi:hypothetical protein